MLKPYNLFGGRIDELFIPRAFPVVFENSGSVHWLDDGRNVNTFLATSPRETPLTNLALRIAAAGTS
jgi:hypothetical protein